MYCDTLQSSSTVLRLNMHYQRAIITSRRGMYLLSYKTWIVSTGTSPSRDILLRSFQKRTFLSFCKLKSSGKILWSLSIPWVPGDEKFPVTYITSTRFPNMFFLLYNWKRLEDNLSQLGLYFTYRRNVFLFPRYVRLSRTSHPSKVTLCTPRD